MRREEEKKGDWTLNMEEREREREREREKKKKKKIIFLKGKVEREK